MPPQNQNKDIWTTTPIPPYIYAYINDEKKQLNSRNNPESKNTHNTDPYSVGQASSSQFASQQYGSCCFFNVNN